MARKSKKSGVQLGILAKIMMVVILPILLVAVILCIVAKNGMSTVAETLAEDSMKATIYSMEQILAKEVKGDYTLQGEELYKGDMNLTADQEFFDNFKEETGVDVTIFYGDTRYATSIHKEDGSSMVGTQASEAVVKTVVDEGKDYADYNLKINGQPYYVYYEPLKQESSGEIVGMLFVGIPRADINAITTKQITQLVCYSVAVLIIAVIIGALIVITIVKSLKSVIGNLDKVSGGDLRVKVAKKELSRSDEVGDVAKSVNMLISSLTGIVNNIVNVSGKLGNVATNFNDSFVTIEDSIGKIDSAVEEIAKGATSQAGETQAAGEQIDSMGQAIDVTAESVTILSQSADKMQKYNESAGRTLSELVDISKKTQNSVDEVHQQTNTTNQSALDIRSATELIADIASQTNLLSLNASIEAARAGEHGRGFAVVADEIRILADQSRESAEKIASIVNELLENSSTSVATMEKLAEVFEEQNDKLKATSQMFDSLDREIVQVGAAVEQISSEVGEIGEKKDSVLDIVRNLAAIAEENAASSEETAASMLELSNIVKDCSGQTSDVIAMSDELEEKARAFKI